MRGGSLQHTLQPTENCMALLMVYKRGCYRPIKQKTQTNLSDRLGACSIEFRGEPHLLMCFQYTGCLLGCQGPVSDFVRRITSIGCSIRSWAAVMGRTALRSPGDDRKSGEKVTR